MRFVTAITNVKELFSWKCYSNFRRSTLRTNWSHQHFMIIMRRRRRTRKIIVLIIFIAVSLKVAQNGRKKMKNNFSKTINKKLRPYAFLFIFTPANFRKELPNYERISNESSSNVKYCNGVSYWKLYKISQQKKKLKMYMYLFQYIHNGYIF